MYMPHSYIYIYMCACFKNVCYTKIYDRYHSMIGMQRMTHTGTVDAKKNKNLAGHDDVEIVPPDAVEMNTMIKQHSSMWSSIPTDQYADHRVQFKYKHEKDVETDDVTVMNADGTRRNARDGSIMVGTGSRQGGNDGSKRGGNDGSRTGDNDGRRTNDTDGSRTNDNVGSRTNDNISAAEKHNVMMTNVIEMTEHDFEHISDLFLGGLWTKLENQIPKHEGQQYEYDIHIDHGIMTITLADTARIQVAKHVHGRCLQVECCSPDCGGGGGAESREYTEFVFDTTTGEFVDRGGVTTLQEHLEDHFAKHLKAMFDLGQPVPGGYHHHA